jgi:cell division protein FtsL
MTYILLKQAFLAFVKNQENILYLIIMKFNKQFLFFSSAILVVCVSLAVFIINNITNMISTKEVEPNSSSEVLQSNSEPVDFLNTQYATKVKNFQFFYSPETKLLRFDGTVALANGCLNLKSYDFDLNQETQKYQLQIEIENRSLNNPDTLCTEIYREIPIQGDKEVDLNSDQLKNFESLFEVIETNI